MRRIIPEQKSVVVAADVTEARPLADLATAMIGVPHIGGVKIGFSSNGIGLNRAASIVRQELGYDIPLIYDHQKAGNDVPEMGGKFAMVLKKAGFSAAILFPFAGPKTQRAWTDACRGEGLEVLIGGVMTHPEFLESEGGYIADSAPERIYKLGCATDVRDFVVPGTKLDWVKRVRTLLVKELGDGNFVLHAPGFITQGGDISECGRIAGDEWHAIVGSAIYNQPSITAMREAAIAITKQIAPVQT